MNKTNEQYNHDSATLIMGWELDNMGWYIAEKDGRKYKVSNLENWQPLTDANQRDMIVEKMVSLGWSWASWVRQEGMLHFFELTDEDLRFGSESKILGMNENLAKAIIDAGLEAVQ